MIFEINKRPLPVGGRPGVKVVLFEAKVDSLEVILTLPLNIGSLLVLLIYVSTVGFFEVLLLDAGLRLL